MEVLDVVGACNRLAYTHGIHGTDDVLVLADPYPLRDLATSLLTMDPTIATPITMPMLRKKLMPDVAAAISLRGTEACVMSICVWNM